MVQTIQKEKVYKVPNLAVDAIVTKKVSTQCLGGGSGEPTEEVEEHEILLITRGRDPFKGMYAFPGGFVDYGEDPANSVIRELKEECCMDGASPELIMVAGAPDRDPRKHVVSIVYSVEVNPNQPPRAEDDAASAEWYNLKEVASDF